MASVHTDVHAVTDRPPLHESVRRERRRGGTSGFARALGDELPAPREREQGDELAPARRAPDAEGEAGTRVDVLA